MCYHVTLTSRDNTEMRYGMMDCKTKVECVMEDEPIAHLMASGQFKKFVVQDDKGRGIRSWTEKEFPAFVEKVLGAGALLKRHHLPEAVGQKIR